MREARFILVLFLVSLMCSGIAHAQWFQTNGLYGVGFVVSGASLFAGTDDSRNHLINNKEYRSKVESAFREREQLAHNRKDKLFNVFKSGLSLQQQEALKFLFAYMPLSDLADYNGDFFLANANIALKTRQESPWGKSIPENIFLHYVLPCRVSSEKPDSFRIVYYEEIQRRVKGMDALHAALEINHWCHEKVTYQPIYTSYTGPMGIVLLAHGSCGAESVFTVASLRTAGIPAREVGTRWAHNDDSHGWVEVWIDGKWHYMGACEPEPVLDRAWFTESARRAMFILTKSFGAKYEHENTMVDYRNYSLVNTLPQYAVTKTITIKVVDANNVPVKGALVEYLILQFGFFSCIAEVTTDEFGISRFETGLGDLLIWARKGEDFNFGKICVNDTDRLELILNRKPADHGSEELDIAAPVEREALKGPAAELIAANTKRTNEEDKIRQAYIDSWMKPEEAANLAKELGADPNTIKDIIKRSMGNYKNIASFLTHTPALDRPLAINLLKQLSDTDLISTTEGIFADHLNNVIKFENAHGACDYDLYSKYVLNPSIAIRMTFGWRKYLFESIPVGFRQEAINDPSILIKYVENNIVLDDEETRESDWPISPLISPRGVDELKVSDSFSRDIYFVALCRSLGIPSRLERRSNGHVPKYYFGGEWHDVWLTGKNQPLPGKGFVRFSSSDKHPAPESFVNFTIAYFKNGHYNTLATTVDFKNELALAPGYYMLVTGNRVNDSKILAALSFFELKENEHKAIDVKLRRWSRNTKDVDLYIAACSGDLAKVKRLTQEGSEVDRKDEWGWTALYWAMRGKQKEVVEFLIAQGANVNVKGAKDLTPLHLAITNNQKELIEMLIAKGVDVNAKDEKGDTPLNLASQHNQKELIEMLIAKGANVNAKNNWNWTPIHSAAENGNKDMVELLIAQGATVNGRDGDNRTPLWYAQKNGYTEIVELLRKHGGVE
jgi:ankyrin repeat protein